MANNNQSVSFSALARLGIGATDPRTMLESNFHTVMENALVAKIVQVVVSMIHLLYNSLFTWMLLGYEWATYAHQRKSLRVSGMQEAEQRSTYFLSLPYKFAIPLIVMNRVLHWLTSQSIFFVALEVRHPSTLVACRPY